MSEQLKFAAEQLDDCWDEFVNVAYLHWKETEGYRHHAPYRPDKDRYQEYCRSGFYRFYTVRNEAGEMVGYGGIYVTVSMHTQQKVAQEDTWFIHPEYRKGRNAINFFKFMENDLKNAGVEEISCSVKLVNGAGRILEYMKYKHVANVYCKDL